MSKVTELGYLGFNIADEAAWRRFATEIVGLEVVDEPGETDRFYLRMDYWHHRMVMHIGGGDDMAYMGWRVDDERALDALCQKLTDAGVTVRKATLEEAKERRVLGLAKLLDPAGNAVELFHSPLIDAHLPFHPGRRLHGKFVTGNQGLGHVLISANDLKASHAFYSLLGLVGDIQYHLEVPNGTAMPVFMHCNGRQHSIAFGVPSSTQLNHLMLEYTSLRDLGKSHDLVRSNKIDVVLQLGMHSNDEALTFYFRTPSPWVMELGWASAEPIVSQQYHLSDVFGHGIETAGALDVKL